MATNRIADDKTRISFQLTKDEREQLQELADEGGVSVSDYIRHILLPAVREGTVVHRDYYIQRGGSRSDGAIRAETKGHSNPISEDRPA